MLKNLISQLSKYAHFWTPLLILIYFGLMTAAYWYHLAIYQYFFKYLFYICAGIISFGIIKVLFNSNTHITAKITTLSFTVIFFCMSSLSLLWLPGLIIKEKFNQNYYYLLAEPELFDAHTWLHLYKCQSLLDCQKTSYNRRDPNNDNFQLVSNAEKNEIHILATLINGQTYLVYTYGNTPRHYEDFEELNNHLYYLVREDSIGSLDIKYSIYECGLDNISCTSLPFRYISDIPRRLIISIKDEAIEVKGFDLDTQNYVVIFTYSENPRCYVEGCEILEQ